MKKKVLCTALVTTILMTTTASAAPWWLSKYRVTFDNELGIVGNLTLTFASDGGCFIRPITKRYGESISLESYIPTKYGYTFKGWFTDPRIKQNQVTTFKFTKPGVLYAKWEKNPEESINLYEEIMSKDTCYLTDEEIAKRAAEIETAVIFPTMYFGEKTGSGEFLGTVIFSPELRLQILKETCNEIYRNGFDKILLYDGHGGNQSMISYFMRGLLYEKTPYSVFDYSLGSDFATPKKLLNEGYKYLTTEDRKILQSYNDQKKRFGHADFIEMGWVFGVRPETVRLDKIYQESNESTHRFDEFSSRRINTPFAWMADFPNSYEGDMHDGMNERIARAMVDYSVGKLADIIKFLKNETTSDEYKAEWLEKQKRHNI